MQIWDLRTFNLLQVSRKNSSKESEIDKKMQKQVGNKKEIKCSDTTA